MDTILYLIRHVESSANDVVTESGLQQAQSLANALSKTEIDLIISSPYQRAIDTVKPFSEIAQIPIQMNDGLKERKVSEGLIRNFLDVIKKSWIDFDFKLPNCESARECQKRLVKTLNGIVSNHYGKKILISSHGNAIALVLNAFDNSFGFEDWKNLNNPDIKKIVYSHDTQFWDREFELKFDTSNNFH